MAVVEKGIWPPPVYVATFADGSTVRMSYHSRAGKALDFARGRQLCCQVIANERERNTPLADVPESELVNDRRYRNMLALAADRIVNNVLSDCVAEDYDMGRDRKFKSKVVLFRDLPQTAPAAASDIVSGHVARDEISYPDPFFAPADDMPAKRKRASVPLAQMEKALAAIRDLLTLIPTDASSAIVKQARELAYA